VGANSAALEYRKAFPREHGRDRAIFEEYVGELSQEELKKLIAKLKEHKFSHLVFSLRHPFLLRIEESNPSCNDG